MFGHIYQILNQILNRISTGRTGRIKFIGGRGLESIPAGHNYRVCMGEVRNFMKRKEVGSRL